VTTLLNNQREFEEAHRNYLIAMGSLLVVAVVIVSMLVVKRSRSAIGRIAACGIYAVSGFDLRRIAERWRSYRPQEREDSSHQIASSGEATVSAAKPTSAEKRTGEKGGSIEAFLNIGRVLMGLWIINGTGHLLLGPGVLGAIQQPSYMFACILQIIAAIAFLSLMTGAIRRRMHLTPAALGEPRSGDE
jgi:hypothetical protein